MKLTFNPWKDVPTFFACNDELRSCLRDVDLVIHVDKSDETAIQRIEFALANTPEDYFKVVSQGLMTIYMENHETHYAALLNNEDNWTDNALSCAFPDSPYFGEVMVGIALCHDYFIYLSEMNHQELMAELLHLNDCVFRGKVTRTFKVMSTTVSEVNIRMAMLREFMRRNASA